LIILSCINISSILSNSQCQCKLE